MAGTTMSDRDCPPTSQKHYVSSEEYRAQLVQDGERRFQEWHTAFLNYQKAFLKEMAQQRKR
ncbi:MAG: hypothetical protein F6J95_019235 [Leptolyngbya sp. SIO1E4]|nr:hypothetical protein [Leptolyngbya sp. SIO1E4]